MVIVKVQVLMVGGAGEKGGGGGGMGEK